MLHLLKKKIVLYYLSVSVQKQFKYLSKDEKKRKPTPTPGPTEAMLGLQLPRPGASFTSQTLKAPSAKRDWQGVLVERMTTNNSTVLHFLTLFQLGRNVIVRKGQMAFFPPVVKRLTKMSTKEGSHIASWYL